MTSAVRLGLVMARSNPAPLAPVATMPAPTPTPTTTTSVSGSGLVLAGIAGLLILGAVIIVGGVVFGWAVGKGLKYAKDETPPPPGAPPA